MSPCRLTSALFASMAFLLVLSCGPGEPRRYPSELRTPYANLILISIDTTRADRLSLYGNARPTTPELDRLSADSIVFDQAHSTAPSTAPSHMSMMTGWLPTAHGVMNFVHMPKAAGQRKGSGRLIRQTLPAGIPTLAERLQDEGYATAGFTGGGNTSKLLGFGRGFDTYDGGGQTGLDRTGRGDFGRAIEWIRKESEKRHPFFAFLHTYIPHSPYLPPPGFSGRYDPGYDGDMLTFDDVYGPDGKKPRGGTDKGFWKSVDRESLADQRQLLARYDEEIGYADSLLGKLMRSFERFGLLEDTLIVVTSDHGEEFNEHGGFMHHAKLWEELLHVPLVLRFPQARGGGRRIAAPVSLVDLSATLLDALGVESADPAPGESWLPRIEGHRPFREGPIVGEFIRKSDRDEKTGKWAPKSYLRSVQLGRYKLVHRFYDGELGEELYDLEEDPGERRNRVYDKSLGATLEKLRDVAARVERESVSRRLPMAKGGAVGGRTEQQLRELGYIR